MTFSEAEEIAQALKARKPDPASGTVGERNLWGRLAHDLMTACDNRVERGWSTARWREAAGMDPAV